MIPDEKPLTFINRENILASCGISESIITNNLDGKKLSQSPDSPQNKNIYNTLIKPKIDVFKQDYGGLSPNMLLNAFLEAYITKNGLEQNFESKGFAYYGQKVNPYCWAAITRKDPLIHDRKTSFFPQLFILINHFGIRFGFCYGDHVSPEDDYVTLVRKDTEIQKSFLNLLKTNNNIHFLIFSEMIDNLKELTPPPINSNEDIVQNWSTDVHMIQYIQKNEIPDNIEDLIKQTFNALLPVFQKLSLRGNQPKPERPLNYWQIAPGAQAKDWDYCRENGIIPIYFREYLKNIDNEVLHYDKNKLTEFCRKKNPEATPGKIGTAIESMWLFLHDVKIGDYILANKGMSKALGWGIVNSEPKLYSGEKEFTIYREVNWKDTNLNRDITKDQGKNFFKVICPITKEHFDSIVNPENIAYWAVLPSSQKPTGNQTEMWPIWKQKQIVSIGWRDLAEKLGQQLLQFSTYDEFVSAYRKIYPETQADMAWKFIYEMQKGDVILANKGHKSIFARGAIKSEAKIFEKKTIQSLENFELLSEWPIYREVEWEEITPEVPIPSELEGKFSRRVVALTKEEYDILFEKSPTLKKTGKKQIILYGPPGTGKTYNSVIRAHEIIFGYEDSNATYRSLQEKLQSQPKNEIDVSQLTWLEAITLTFYESKKEKLQVDDIKKSRIIRDFSIYKNNRFISNTIWNLLLRDAKLDSETVKVKNKTGREYFDKDIESNWFLTEKGKEFQKGLIEDLTNVPESSNSQFNFITFHQSFSYEDFVEGIRPDLKNADETGIVYRIKDGIFKEICKKAAMDPAHNYVLVIDEINRGNISKIFGELITLLEDNKRIGEKEEITVKLPYSNETFGVPSNVYIIGTMNSTDKSIALVDIALRRRFHFERLNVEYELIKNSDAKVFLKELNSIICAAKNADYEIGHYYFMNIPEDDPGNQELENIFSNQILPLLEEYFFNDWEALATILGREAIKIETKKKFVWDEDSGKFEEDEGDYDQIYGRCLKSPDTVFESTMKNLGIKKSNQEINP